MRCVPVERNRGRAGELQGIGAGGKHAVLSVADLAPCDAASSGRGVAVDLADLRARYRVAVEQATARLNDVASRPVPPRPRPREDTKRDGDRKGSNSGRG